MRKNLEGYVPEPGRSGKTRHRVRVKGQPKKRVTVSVGPEHDEFIAHYNAARKGQLVNLEPEKKPEIETHANSLDTAITGYLKYLERGVTNGTVSPTTLAQRKSSLIRTANFVSPEEIRLGEYHFKLDQDALEFIRDEWGAVTAQADNCTKAFVALYKWLKVKPNSVSDVKKVQVNIGGAKA